tara:strand:+ start:1940 stop:2155 length:216 start_codon:yes stop_codon:yes gene_type:complete
MRPYRLHTFIRENRKAEVYKYHNEFIVKCYIDGELIGQRLIEEHNESYAEEAAENYVDGIWELEEKEYGLF